MGYVPGQADQALQDGAVVLLSGWAGDLVRAREKGLPVGFVLPAEGSIQWGDNFVVPKNSPRKALAEAFINFVMRPQISAQIVNEQFYATANEAAYPYIRAELRDDPVIFPPLAEVRRAEVLMPLSPAGKALHDRIWNRYLAAPGRPDAGRE
jgi:spermidine/putrescine-binding protein